MNSLLVIEDLSCLGKCSLTIALPVLSALRCSTSLLPTTILSTHTGFPDRPHIVSLSEELSSLVAHWQKEGIVFDGILIGYLGSKALICEVEKLLPLVSDAHTRIFLDPVLGDHGRLYSGLSSDCIAPLSALCQKADVLFPNLTEACLLSGLPYPEQEVFTKEYYTSLLAGFPAKKDADIILTGAALSAGSTGVFVKTKDDCFSCEETRVPENYHGTGDLFASLVTGLFLSGMSLSKACRLSCRLTKEAIEKSLTEGAPKRFGLAFEDILPDLTRIREAIQ